MKYSLQAFSILILSAFTRLAFAAESDTIWMDQKWNVVSSREDAQFFRLMGPQSDSGYLLRDFFLSGQIQEQSFSTDPRGSIKNGYARRYDSSGNLRDEGMYKMGSREGVWTFYARHNATSVRGSDANYRNDQRNGAFRRYDTVTGGLTVLGNYKDDLQSGTWTWFYLGTESPRIVKNYAEGKANGTYISYFPNGTTRRKETYASGIRTGEGCLFDSTGREIPYVELILSPRPRGDRKSQTVMNAVQLCEEISKTAELRRVYSYTHLINEDGTIGPIKVDDNPSPMDDCAKQFLAALAPYTPMLYMGKAVTTEVVTKMEITEGGYVRFLSTKYRLPNGEDQTEF